MRHSCCKRRVSITNRSGAYFSFLSQQCHLLLLAARCSWAGTGAPPAALGSARRPFLPLTVGPQVPRAAPTRLPPPRWALQPSSSPHPPAPATGGFMLRPLAGWLVAPCAAAAGRGAPSTCAPGEHRVLRHHGAHGKAKPWSCVQKLWRWPDLRDHRCLAEQILCALHKYL